MPQCPVAGDTSELMSSPTPARRYLGAEQVSSDDDDADAHHEVWVGAGVALVDDATERYDALLDVDADEDVDETDENVDEEHDRQVRTAVLTRLCRQVDWKPRHRCRSGSSRITRPEPSDANSSSSFYVYRLDTLFSCGLLRKSYDAIGGNFRRLELARKW